MDRSISDIDRDVLLSRLCERNLPLELFVAGQPAAMKSRFLAGPRRTASGCLLIELPTLAGKPFPCRPRDSLDVRVMSGGDRYGFRTIVRARARARLSTGLEIAALEVAVPERIVFLQRREHYRVKVPAAEPIPVECAAKAPDSAKSEADARGLLRFAGNCLDMSVGGVCVRLSCPHFYWPTPGVRVILSFRIPGAKRAKLLAESRHGRQFSGASDWAVGFEFVDTLRTLASRRTINAISRYVTRRQREELKRKSGIE